MCKVNILLVDDESRNLDVLESILESPEYNLVRARNANQALNALLGEDFAVIVLDIRMPDMNGLELAQIIKQRKKTQHLPIIFLTAYYQEDEHVMQGYGAGAVDYLSKPCNPAILQSKVAVFVDLFRKTLALERENFERRQAEERVKELNDQLGQRVADLAMANDEMEAFSYSVSHDLRSPLRQVAGFVGLMKQEAGDQLPAAAAQYIPLIENSVKRMGTLIDDLLAFSRYGRVELNFQPVNLQALFEQARQSLQMAAQGREVQWIVDDLPVVYADPALLMQVLVNLLENALKFTRMRATATIELGHWAAEGERVVYIKDNGTGYDPKYAQKLFGVFQRLHGAAEFEGAGIGLANVRRIVQRHGGRTWAESAFGQGATFFFSLPETIPALVAIREAELA